MEDGRAARKGSFDPKVINLLKRGAVMRIANLSLSNKIPTSTFSIYYLREFDKQERRALIGARRCKFHEALGLRCSDLQL